MRPSPIPLRRSLNPGPKPSIFSIVIGGGIKTAKKSVDALRKKLARDSLANALQAHVYAPFATRAATREAAGTPS